MMLFRYKDEMGQFVDIEEINKGHEYFDRLVSHREKLVEQLSNFCDDLADQYLSGLDPHEIE